MTVFQLWSIFRNEDETEFDFVHDGTFANPELAQAWVPRFLREGTYRWRLTAQTPHRWIAPIPRKERPSAIGWPVAFVIDEDRVIEAMPD